MDIKIRLPVTSSDDGESTNEIFISFFLLEITDYTAFHRVLIIISYRLLTISAYQSCIHLLRAAPDVL